MISYRSLLYNTTVLYDIYIKFLKRSRDLSFDATIKMIKQELNFSQRKNIIFDTIISCIVLQKVRKQDGSAKVGMRVL